MGNHKTKMKSYSKWLRVVHKDIISYLSLNDKQDWMPLSTTMPSKADFTKLYSKDPYGILLDPKC